MGTKEEQKEERINTKGRGFLIDYLDISPEPFRFDIAVLVDEIVLVLVRFFCSILAVGGLNLLQTLSQLTNKE